MLLAITYFSAVLAAFFNATAAIIQRLATKKPAARKLFSHKFAYEMMKSRKFLLGLFLQFLAAVAQAVALKNGGLSMVEPLLTSDLIFLLLIIHFRLKVRMKPRDWSAALAVSLGLTGLYLATNPREGHLNFQALPWIVLASVAAPIVIVLAVVIRKLKSARVRAVLAGIAAATSFAMNAALAKLSLNEFSQHGLRAVLSGWPLYAFIVSGIISLYLMVNAYGSGPLALTQPIMEVCEPAMAVTIGIMIFGDRFNSSLGSISFGVICALITIGGIILLGSSPRLQTAADRHGV